MEIIFKKGNIIENIDSAAIYLHSCNASNNWGAGVALCFKNKFNKAYLSFIREKHILGECVLVEDISCKVACLITSKGYGSLKDPPRDILKNTYTSLIHLLKKCDDKDITIHSVKINSGLFETPWEATEKIIRLACSKFEKNIKWFVWEL